jgi:hypothetical protein
MAFPFISSPFLEILKEGAETFAVFGFGQHEFADNFEDAEVLVDVQIL